MACFNGGPTPLAPGSGMLPGALRGFELGGTAPIPASVICLPVDRSLVIGSCFTPVIPPTAIRIRSIITAERSCVNASPTPFGSRLGVNLRINATIAFVDLIMPPLMSRKPGIPPISTPFNPSRTELRIAPPCDEANCTLRYTSYPASTVLRIAPIAPRDFCSSGAPARKNAGAASIDTLVGASGSYALAPCALRILSLTPI